MAESPAAPHKPDVWVVTATYNERQNLPQLLGELLELSARPTICIVDDNSPDGTRELADQYQRRYPDRIRVIHRQSKLGYASAHRQGMRLAVDSGSMIIITMDADLSHDPAIIPPMLEELAEADVVVGSRYVAGGRTENWSAFRVLLSRVGGAIARLLAGLPQADPTSGFRAYRRQILQRANPWSTTATGYGFLVDLLFRCQRLGARISEIPIVYHDRQAGKSKLSRKIILESALLCFRLLLQRLAKPVETYADNDLEVD